jgi:hypothetical protein
MNWSAATPLILLLALATGVWVRRGPRSRGAWERSAQLLGGAFDGQRKAVGYAFGRAPWQATAGPESSCALLVHAETHAPPFWIVETHLPQRHANWGAAGQKVFGVTVAVVRVGVHTGPKLQPLAADPGYSACTNGAFLFVWEEAADRSTGKKQKPARLPALLRQALLAAAPLEAEKAAKAILGPSMPAALGPEPAPGA